MLSAPAPVVVYLTSRQVATRYGLRARQSVWRWVKDGRLPKPSLQRAPLTPALWRLDELEAADEKLRDALHQAPRL